MLFIIPAPLAYPAAAPAPVYSQYVPPAPEPAPEPAPNPFAHLNLGGPAAAAPAADAPAEAPAPAEPEFLHIPCPNGHELETPLDMLDQEVLCPQCQAQFLLRRQDSVEFKKKQEEAERIRLHKLSNAWLQWAIIAVVVVVLGLLGLIVMSALNK